MGVGEIVAQRRARLGLPSIGAWQRRDPLAEPIETEAVRQPVVHRRDGFDRQAALAARGPLT